MQVIVAGGSGFVGRHLVRAFEADGHEVRVVTRTPEPSNKLSLGWNEAAAAVDGADAVVNVAGESVGGLRWTRAKREWFPWIHVDDLVRVFAAAIANSELAGPVHAVAPQQLRQRDAARDVASVLHRPAVVPTPAPMLRALLGREADLLLHGQRAVSTKLEPLAFRHATLRAALEDALR